MKMDVNSKMVSTATVDNCLDKERSRDWARSGWYGRRCKREEIWEHMYMYN